jgi:hypothetical protein
MVTASGAISTQLLSLMQVVELITVPRLAPLALGLAYHLSLLDSAKGTFVFTDALHK